MEDDKKMEEAVVPSPTAVVLLGGQGQHLSSSSSSAAADNHDEIETRKQGGLITMPFIIGNEAFEKVASYGVAPNMIMYLMKDYKMGVAKAANILFLWSAVTNFMPLFGAFLSDSFLGRYLTITIGSFFTLLGTILLWLTAMLPQTKPPSVCNTDCVNPTVTAPQLALLFSALALMSIGAGGIRPCSLAFGADQVDNRANPAKNKRILETFFGWYYASTALSVLIALTAVVYIQDRFGWRLGFGIPVILMFLSALLFLVASPFYVKHKATMSLLTGFAQVVVAAYKNRTLPFPPANLATRSSYHCTKGSNFLAPTKKLRYNFFHLACIIINRDNDVTPDGLATNPWRLCTVDQVEELKAIIKVIPIWSSGIMLSINTSQTSFPLLQASSMDRHLTSAFQIPAASYSMFLVVTIIVWVVLYDRAILPLASKLWGRPVKLSTKLRMGLGLVVSSLSMVAAATVENARRKKAIQEGYLNNPIAVVNMSAMWLVPQYVLLGLAESLNAIGQIEFYYSEFPKSMSSIASCLFGVGMGVASLLSSVILSVVNKTTSKDGKQGWINDNINQARYDNYYWVLAIMGAVNVVYFLLCSWAYGACADEMTKVGNGGNVFNEEDEMGNDRHSLEGKEQLNR
ncbi:Protein NRT1/ PTR FAMILY 1.2 [Linum perenne]